MNLFIGFEQANKYVIMNSSGQQIGYMEEKDVGMAFTFPQTGLSATERA